MKINLNDTCKFELTDRGRLELWKYATYERWGVPLTARVREDANRFLDVCHPGWNEPHTVIKMQLWRVMEVFGPGTHMGGDNLIKNLTLEIETDMKHSGTQ